MAFVGPLGGGGRIIFWALAEDLHRKIDGRRFVFFYNVFKDLLERRPPAVFWTLFETFC